MNAQAKTIKHIIAGTALAVSLAAGSFAYGKWWTIFGTGPATGVCAYFVLKERERARG